MPENILLVDDDKEFREELRDYLEGYEVVEASNGEEALKLLKKPHEIELVILDVMMPGLRGTEVLKEIKKIDSNMSIIILTGHSSKEVMLEALQGHADDYIEKPLDIDRTREIVEKVLEAKKGNAEMPADDVQGKVERVKRFLERNCYKKVSLEDAADTVYLSPKYLSRVFKENTGMGFSDYKLEVKIRKAKELLDETGGNIDQIADKLGYQNTESFIRIFEKLTGYTPTQYRNKDKTKKKKKVVSSRKVKRKDKSHKGKRG